MYTQLLHVLLDINHLLVSYTHMQLFQHPVLVNVVLVMIETCLVSVTPLVLLTIIAALITSPYVIHVCTRTILITDLECVCLSV